MVKRLQALFTRLVLFFGAATFLYLLWTFDPARIWKHLAAFGWGFAILLPFQILDHLLNATGWLLAFPPEHARRARFWDLVRVRIAGDGVNYLTPSANVAGEFIRPGMLQAPLSEDVKVTSVLVAKIAQAAGQAFFVLLGLAYLFHAGLFAFVGRQAVVGAMAMLGILGGVCFGGWLLAAEPSAAMRRRFPRAVEKTASVRRLLRDYLGRHPGRLAGSIVFFMLGYAWGAAEVWIIARFLGLSLGVEMALSIEFLSNLVDALAFMVPAKIGTQEAGKTAIFAGLGLSPELGFTLGVVRHVREMSWALFGFGLYALHQRRGRG